MSNTDPNSLAPDAVARGGGITNAFGKVSLTSDDAADRLISSSLRGSPDTSLAITYAFRRSGTSPDASSTGFQRFGAQQIAAAEKALAAWSGVANIHFQRVDDGDGYSDNATILFGDYLKGDDAGFTILPGSRASGSAKGDVWINASLSYNLFPTQGNYGGSVLIHEIGHAPGLSHPSDYDGENAGTYLQSAGYAEDYTRYTVMSYFDQPSSYPDGASNFYAFTPQIDDITAVQRLYGANVSSDAGDTVYGFGSNSPNLYFHFTSANQSFGLSVSDGGGNDTLDFSGFSQANTVMDLRQGQFSTAGTNYLSIAYGTVIENAVGRPLTRRLLATLPQTFFRQEEVAPRSMAKVGTTRL